MAATTATALACTAAALAPPAAGGGAGPPPRAPASRAAHRPSCFGAAARDPLHPCRNPALALAVIPAPAVALLTPNAFCEPLGFRGLNVCGFGARPPRASATVALVGNSHASHWRAALAVVARALAWRGISITRSSCPFTLLAVDLPRPGRRACARWRRGVLRWLDEHPEVHTLFTTNQPTAPLLKGGVSPLAAEIAGYEAIWARLPSSITHIVVIRDNPYNRSGVLDCVEAAVAQHADAALRCAEPRDQALKPDPAAIAAREMRSPRVRVIDMTRYFCDQQLCYPVVGGALVYRDADHLTRVFASTLGPYLLREVRRVLGARG